MKILLLILFTFPSFAYVLSKSDNGSNLRWVKEGNQIPIYVDPTPLGLKSSNITSSSVISSFQESIDDWNRYSPYELVPFYSTTTKGRNSVSFSNDSALLGSGVVAITEVNFNARTGTITSANIYLNDSFNNGLDFTADESQSGDDKAFLGDVFSHELGHFLGLSHCVR